MQNELLTDKLKIEKADKKDWNKITDLLKEANLFSYIPTGEGFENFYVVKSDETKNTICCFALYIKNDIAILKSYAIKNELRGKGIGKNIANKLPDLGKLLGLKKIYAASWEAGDFWRKAGFKEINLNESTNSYFLKYTNYLEKDYPQFSEETRYFVLNL